MDETRIDEVANELALAIEDELKAAERLDQAEAAVNHRRNALLSAAYEAGTINGKNDTTRDLQSYIILDADTALDWLERYAAQVRNEKNAREAARKVAEIRVSLTKAYLYSLSGMGAVR